jgi:hypothetical protein
MEMPAAEKSTPGYQITWGYLAEDLSVRERAAETHARNDAPLATLT